MHGIAEFLWGAVLGERSAAWLFQASDEQRRNGPQRNSARRITPKCGPRVVALLAKGVTISRVATPSGNPHLGATIPYIKSKSALGSLPCSPSKIFIGIIVKSNATSRSSTRLTDFGSNSFANHCPRFKTLYCLTHLKGSAHH